MDKKAILLELRSNLEKDLMERLTDSDTDATAELARQIRVLKFLPILDYSKQTLIEPGALVEARPEGREHSILYCIIPQLTGLISKHKDHALQVISPESQLGEALLGKNVGDHIQVKHLKLEILAVW